MRSISIGGASGYWGDAVHATRQLLDAGNIDYLVYDYLAEITMSILARARSADDNRGYALDFVGAILRPNLHQIADQGVKVIANAGGVNPIACGNAIEALIGELELELKVAVVVGDDVMAHVDGLSTQGITEIFSGESFPDVERVASANAYLGAFPIASALSQGADIVVTGRCVDSAVTLGACIHEFNWQSNDYDLLAAGTLAGHILECGTQATGGNYTDWEDVVDSLDNAGYPIATIQADGSIHISKPENTSGLVSVGTVAEQMLYEIGNPQCYTVPDVNCDFSEVVITQEDTDLVSISGAKGHGAPDTYKVSLTWQDGFRAGQSWTMYGRDADIKGHKFASTVYERTNSALARMNMPPLSETLVENIGSETHYGAARTLDSVREVDTKIAAKHPEKRGIEVFIKEMSALALTAPPGLTGFAGARAKASPVVRLFSFLIPKNQLTIECIVDKKSYTVDETLSDNGSIPEPHSVPATSDTGEMIEVPLESIAWGRSGDKGNKANVGIIARVPEFLPYIAASLTADRVQDYFSHYLTTESVECFYLPGISGLNFLLHNVLGGGGVASLRNDPQGKGYAQLLLAESISIPKSLASHQALKKLS